MTHSLHSTSGTYGLCGGWSYAALDYFFSQVPVPNQTFRPANGTALHGYLYQRCVDQITGNLDKWAEIGFNPGGARNTEFFNWGLSAAPGGRIDELKQYLDNRVPVPIGLQGDGSTGNHVVVAIGYDMGRYAGDLGNFKEDFKILVCDPNAPTRTRTLIPDVANELYRFDDGGGEGWRTYFVDRKYSTHQPPASSSSRPIRPTASPTNSFSTFLPAATTYGVAATTSTWSSTCSTAHSKPTPTSTSVNGG